MKFKDLAPYGYGLDGRALPGTACVGWLGTLQVRLPSWRRTTPEFRRRLEVLAAERSVNAARGSHVCASCRSANLPIARASDGAARPLGSAEIWVPARDRSVIFIAPNLVHHYVTAHGYAPPRAFVDAVLASEETYASWDPSVESQRLLGAARARSA